MNLPVGLTRLCYVTMTNLGLVNESRCLPQQGFGSSYISSIFLWKTPSTPTVCSIVFFQLPQHVISPSPYPFRQYSNNLNVRWQTEVFSNCLTQMCPILSCFEVKLATPNWACSLPQMRTARPCRLPLQLIWRPLYSAWCSVYSGQTPFQLCGSHLLSG